MSVFFSRRAMERKKYIMRLPGTTQGGGEYTFLYINGDSYNNPSLNATDLLVELTEGTIAHFVLTENPGTGFTANLTLNGIGQLLEKEEDGKLHYYYQVHTNFAVMLYGKSFPGGIASSVTITEE